MIFAANFVKIIGQDAPILQDNHPIAAMILIKCFGLLFFYWPFLLMAFPPSNNEIEKNTNDKEAKNTAKAKSFAQRCFCKSVPLKYNSISLFNILLSCFLIPFLSIIRSYPSFCFAFQPIITLVLH